MSDPTLGRQDRVESAVRVISLLPAATEIVASLGMLDSRRPGPRIVDSLEILAEILHPEIFRGRFPVRGVVRVG